MGPTFFRSQAEENLTGGNGSERRKNRAKSAIRKEGGYGFLGDLRGSRWNWLGPVRRNDDSGVSILRGETKG